MSQTVVKLATTYPSTNQAQCTPIPVFQGEHQVILQRSTFQVTIMIGYFLIRYQIEISASVTQTRPVRGSLPVIYVNFLTKIFIEIYPTGIKCIINITRLNLK